MGTDSGPVATVEALDPRADLARHPTRAQRFMTLPNGLEIACQSRTEGQHIYEDLFDKRIYMRHGIALRDGACVYDVGGNIGLFTLFVHLNYRDCHTYTFEPAPPLFEILRTNVGRHGAGRHGGWCRIFNCGVSDRPGSASLTFYPYSSGMSSFYADEGEEKEILRAILQHELEHGVEGVDTLAATSEEFLDARFTSHTFDCPMLPLSEVFRRQGTEVVDLLKVDVQKAELDVLLGIAPEDWPRIRQVVLEVHDLDDKLAKVHALLAEHGFQVVTEQDPLLDGTVLYNLFAINQRVYAAAGHPAPDQARRRAEQQRRALRQRRGAVRRQGTTPPTPSPDPSKPEEGPSGTKERKNRA